MATCAEAFHTSSRQRIPSSEAPACECPDSCTQLALPIPPRIGQLSTGRASSAAVKRSDQPAVRHQDDRPLGFIDAPLGLFGDELSQQRHAARCDVDPAFATVGRPPCVVSPRQPCARGRGVHLEMGQALPVTEVRFAQSGVDEHRLPRPLAKRDSGIQRAPQVRRHDDERLPLRQHLGGSGGLLATQVGQLGVELALHPAACVVLGLPVTQHDQSADPHDVASRSTGMTGQSRHNRSRA